MPSMNTTMPIVMPYFCMNVGGSTCFAAVIIMTASASSRRYVSMNDVADVTVNAYTPLAPLSDCHSPLLTW